MASNSSVLIDKSLLSKLDQSLHKIESLFALISGLAVFSLMMLAVISVTGRHSINQPLPGYVDWIEQAMPLIAFMGIAYTQRNGGHIRMDILVSFLNPGRGLFFPQKWVPFYKKDIFCVFIIKPPFFIIKKARHRPI